MSLPFPDNYYWVPESEQEPVMVTNRDGIKMWIQNGRYHRTDGPAMIMPGGTKAWYIKGMLHRLDGPAVEYMSGARSWFINGEELTEDTFNERLTKLKEIERGSKEAGANLDF